MKFKSRFFICSFFIASLSGCWTFDDGTKQGFTIDGVYDGGTYTRDTYCTDNELNNWLTLSPFSHQYDSNSQARSLRMSVVGKCFPGKGMTGYSRFDFVSPNPDEDWDVTDGFTFVMNSNIPGIQIQPLLSVRRADGTIVKKKSIAGPEFIAMPSVNINQWHDFKYTRAAIEQGEEVMAVHIRVFIPYNSLIYSGPEAVVQLDDVIPNE